MEFSRLWSNSEIDQSVHQEAERRVREVLAQDQAASAIIDRTGESLPRLPWDKEKAMDAALVLMKAGQMEPEMLTQAQVDSDPAESLLEMTETLLGAVDQLAGARA